MEGSLRNFKMKTMHWAFLLLFPIYSHAADDPPVIIDDSNYKQQMCVQNTAQDCINTMCLNSEDINCPDKCQTDAQEKCKSAAVGDN